jgi:hypothetical protein
VYIAEEALIVAVPQVFVSGPGSGSVLVLQSGLQNFFGVDGRQLQIEGAGMLSGRLELNPLGERS